MIRHAIRQLNTGDYAAAARVYNHYVTTSTATFQTEPVTPDEWAAEALAGEPGRHGAWAIAHAPAPDPAADPAHAPEPDPAADPAHASDSAPGPGPHGQPAGPGHSPWSGDSGVPTGSPDADGALAGYVLVTPFKSRCAYRDTAEVTVYLAPDQTGRGLGRAALAHVDAHAAAAGLHALLAVVCAENDASLRAFERAGYQRCALLREVGSKFGRLLDVVYLEKVIESQP